MRIKLDFTWEVLDPFTARAKVIGGWIVLSDKGKSSSMIFIPDSEHGWMIIKPAIEPEKKPVA